MELNSNHLDCFFIIMDKLTRSPRLNALLRKMDIYSFYDVINHLPRRYDDYNPTEETNLSDKQRVVLYGQIVSAPRIVRARNIKIITFDFITIKKHYFKIVAFNREFLMNVLKVNEFYTIIGNYNKKQNEINFINLAVIISAFRMDGLTRSKPPSL